MQDIVLDGSGYFFNIFPTPVGCYTDNEYLNVKDKFMEMCYYEMNLDTKGRIVSNRKGWQSKSEWIFEERNKFFCDYIHKMCEKLFYDVFDHSGELSFSIKHTWININPPGAYNIGHTHPLCDYAGVFYVNLPEEPVASPIVFESVHNHTSGLTHCMHSNNYREMYGLFPEIELYPSEGTLVIFPSALRHFVEENNSDTERISIAFNIVIEDYGRFGDGTKRGRIKC
jgi:uncharacterized protein (TIGR02466 family)